MKAMIFAAGLGTRLKPLTNDRPKALVEVAGITMLELAILKLKNAGVDQIIINIHHYAEMVRDFIKNKKFDIEIAFSDESDLLLDTGGGLKKAQWFLSGDEPFFVYNVDVLSDIDLSEMMDSHNKSHALATLAIKDRPGSRFFLFDDQYRLCGWKNITTGEERISIRDSGNLTPIAFSCIHVMQPTIFELLEEKGVFSIIDVYLRLASDHLIRGFYHNEDFWMDLGKPDKVALGTEAIQQYGRERFV